MSSPGLFARYSISNPATSVVKDSNALRIGILGAARITPNSLILPARTLSSIVVVSVAARDHAKAIEYAKKWDIPTTHASYQELIDDPTIDCIYNPLPNSLHFAWTKLALEAGKHVLLEKPATSNADQARELFALAKAKDLVLLEAFHYRFHPASLYFRDLVLNHAKDNKHPIQKITAILTFFSIYPATDIRYQYDLAGGALMDMGSYTINAIRYFTDSNVESIEETLPTSIKPNLDGRFEAVLRLENGATAEIIAALNNPWLEWRSWQEITPRIVVETDDKIFTYGVYILPGGYHYLTVKDKKTGKTENLPKQYQDGHQTYQYQLRAFVEAVRKGGYEHSDIPGWVTGEDSITNMAIIDSLYKHANMKLRV
ncbi:hypothetical protein DFQ27_007692 [Actinomortierella ambigua]|uniref:D-xylose 1-dehydrogenase (NADP(+), D-xylono-1,5-lactone-forming) n=1 Tax=Actinomortierella ambigua TaxID=1343610 RepID=A0A9P6TZR5_9FUNG|nr:hypothetical protein DFQ27_007692 [Actinomortierella ambigua]